MKRFDCYFGNVTLRATGRHVHEEGEYVLYSEHKAMIDKLLELLDPGEEPTIHVEGATKADWDLWAAKHNPWNTKQMLYERALRITRELPPTKSEIEKLEEEWS